MGAVRDVDVGALYREHRERVTGLVRGEPQDRLRVACPACPGWTVHDVVAHLAGVAVDAVAGRLAGVPSEAQTAAQVAERRERPTVDVLEEWEVAAGHFEPVLTALGIAILPAAIDVAVHEHDIRGALGRPGARTSAAIAVTVRTMTDRWLARLSDRDLAAPCVVAPDGAVLAGDAASSVRWNASEYEVFRTAFGRRSAAQFAAAFDGADPAPYLAALLAFGLTEHDLCD